VFSVKFETRLKKTVGRQIKVLRKEKRLSQDELADMVGIEQSVLSKFERGAASPSLLRLALIAKALDTTLAELCRDI
jgi:transcriptional regulator with XRE-family HTH domain